MNEAVTISNEQTLKSGIKDLVLFAMQAGAHGMANLKNCVLRDDQNNQIEFEIAVTLQKVSDVEGNQVFFNPVNVAEKRQQFAKDLNKLISGEYILAPKEPNEKQKRTAMFIAAQNGNAIEAYKAMLADLETPTQEESQA